MKKNWGVEFDQWKNICPPWLPTQDDLALMLSVCPVELMSRSHAKVLVLGVTPALISMPWPKSFEICAVDYDKGMIELEWPSVNNERAMVTCANWKNIPFADDYFDLIVGDASFCALPSLADYYPVLKEIMRVRKLNATIITRFFMRPQPSLKLRDIVDPVQGLKFDKYSSSELRLLTLMTLAELDATINHMKLSNHIESNWGKIESFIEMTSFNEGDAEKWRYLMESGLKLNFPTLSQINEQFSAFGFFSELYEPPYPSGRFCPTIRFSTPEQISQ